MPCVTTLLKHHCRGQVLCSASGNHAGGHQEHEWMNKQMDK